MGSKNTCRSFRLKKIIIHEVNFDSMDDDCAPIDIALRHKTQSVFL